ncbi:GAF domain-containing protein [Hymenobacter algoricola]|uniref:GAF domain-containing protein n=1 Tax=Hymenobacter algoricola TaxID=486267 RepID=A0ABP7MMM2_9BACT
MPLSRLSLIPGNDEDRLRALSRYEIVGTAPEGLFDELTTLTAKLFGAPIALVSLVAEGSVWLKAQFGLPGVRQVARTQSLCSVAVLHDEVTVFEDLQARPCALVEPQALQALNLQFYAGQPLRTPEGFNIGALCVIDRKARTFSADEQALLQHLAATVMLLLELRLAGLTQAQPASSREQAQLTIPALIHSLTLLAEIGSTGSAVDAWGNAVATAAIHQEAGHLTGLLNRTLTEVLAG